MFLLGDAGATGAENRPDTLDLCADCYYVLLGLGDDLVVLVYTGDQAVQVFQL